jgi:hypothetical protein
MHKNISVWLVFSLLLLMIACTLEEPSLPSWMANWLVPFESGYTMEEVLSEPNFLADTTASGQYVVAFSIEDSTEERSVSSSDLSILPESDHASSAIDNLSLGTIGPESSNAVAIETILGAPLVVGNQVSVPASTIDVDLIYLLYVDVGWADIKSGHFHLEFVNNTFLSIQSGMQIDIYDDSTDVLIGVAEFPDPIGPLSSAVASPDMDLSEKTVHTRFLLRVHMPVEEVSNKVIGEEDLDDSIWVNGTLISVDVHQAEAMFPEQFIDIFDSTSVMEEEHRVRTATIDHGKVSLKVNNGIDATANIQVTLLNFTNPAGELLTETLSIAAKQETDITIELNDYLIADYPDRNSGNLIDYLAYEVHVVTEPTGEYTLMTEDDSVTVNVTPDSLFFSKIDGRVNAVEIEIDPVEKNDFEELSKIDGTIYLDSLEMTLNVYNGTGIPVSLTLNISGEDATEKVTLPPIQIEAGASDVTQVKLSGTDPHPNIIDLMAIIPTSIRMEATALVDGDGSVEIGQTVYADYQIYSPLFLRITEKSYLQSDIMEETLDDDVRDKIANNLQNAAVVLAFENGLPVGSAAAIFVAVDSTDLFDEEIADSSAKFIIREDASGKALTVPAAPVDGSGFVDEMVSNQFQVELTQAQLDLFSQNPKVYIGTKMELNKTSGLVKFRLKDKITTYGQFRFNFLMNKD